MTQKDAIKKHLVEFGSITSWDAIECYGITRLSDVIYRLRRQDGLIITSELKTVKTRFGTHANVSVYKLKKDVA